MQFNWTYEQTEPQLLRTFLKGKGLSKGLLAKIKFQGGTIRVNQQIENVLYQVKNGDQVAVTIPDEAPHETMLLDDQPLEIVFEDDHLLVVEKPAGVASIPAQYHPNGTMANRVKAYYVKQGYQDQVIHIVTRLDRDTSGLMLFAKHGFAHAMMDQELRKKQVSKKYFALVGGKVAQLAQHGEIEAPISRDRNSLMQRQVTAEGRYALTEYWCLAHDDEKALVDIQLHTGRTHQIRVHFAYLGTPLLGDDMYGGDVTQGITRQALHCHQLRFRHPFTQEDLNFESPLPPDMAAVATEIER